MTAVLVAFCIIKAREDGIVFTLLCQQLAHNLQLSTIILLACSLAIS